MNNTEKSKLKLISTHDEAGNVRTFVFETGGLTWLAGQNQGYILREAGGNDEENEHWFTISSAPSEGTINISTRISDSKFKKALNRMVPGDEIVRHTLDGDFIWEEENSDRVVMVAGGIGVTPFRSILLERNRLGKSLNATLLYFNRTDEIPFLREFESLEKSHPEFKLQTVIGERISADKILELAPFAKSQIVYLSGPEVMVEAVGGELREAQVNVKQDWFPGYDEKNY